MTDVLDIRGVSKRFGPVEVLRDITLSLEAGGFLVLLGPSGCGKSTLLNCIAGLEEVTNGMIAIGGRDMTDVPPKDRDIAMVFQSYALYPTMTVAENITFGMKVRGESRAARAEAVARVADVLQIEKLLDRKPSALSGGQRQRVAMGRALVRDPQLFLFDEPLSNLDAKLRIEMRAEIKRLHQTVGASIVYVTHDQIEAMTLATKIAVLKDGNVQQVGTPLEIYNRPANTFVAGFMGVPPMNLVPGELDDEGLLRLGGGVDLQLGEAAPAARGPVLFGVRPEDISAGQEGVALPLHSVEHTGSDIFAVAAFGPDEIHVRLSAREEAGLVDTLPVVIPPEAMHFFDPSTGARLS